MNRPQPTIFVNILKILSRIGDKYVLYFYVLRNYATKDTCIS
jgi:hypothetical protein